MNGENGPCLQLKAINTLQRFVNSEFDEAGRQRISDRLSQAARELLWMDAPAHDMWFPVALYVEIYDSLTADLPDSDSQRELLRRLGVRTAQDATNTFMRLVMLALPSGVVLRQVPKFYHRYANFGVCKVTQLDDHFLEVVITDAWPWKQLPILAAGWLEYLVGHLYKAKVTVANKPDPYIREGDTITLSARWGAHRAKP
jgi:hypothetical protein